MLEHGGRLRAASERYRIPLSDWLDLSTGINPHGYPVPAIPAQAWLRLPEDDDGLLEAAARYYGTAELLPTAGTQPALQALPDLIFGERVTLLHPTYAEHRHAWRGRQVHTCGPDELAAHIPHSDVVVLVHPNNPTGTRFDSATLRDWHRQLAARNGTLIVDEAFIDATPEHSLAAAAGTPGLVILRSLGKFFGLGGARVGFVLAAEALRTRLADALGPWTLSGPARHVARAALLDSEWQAMMLTRLHTEGTRLATLLRQHGCREPAGPALFQWLCTPHAADIQDRLARNGILVRRFDDPSSLRFGLPATESDWRRLSDALRHIDLS
ncbi:MAG: threonine-phosphate decarboxylase [Rhodocyclales bacterium]|nr:threonine-phosphate decarboxylase [Rhodocyclales bacterium]